MSPPDWERRDRPPGRFLALLRIDASPMIELRAHAE